MNYAASGDLFAPQSASHVNSLGAHPTANQESEPKSYGSAAPSIIFNEVSIRPNQSEDAPITDVPDGGLKAWLVVVGAYLALFSSFGVVNAYGVFQEYYTTTLLPNASPSVISLIGSLQLFILYGLSPLIGKLFDTYGPNILLPLGSLIIVASMMLLSICQAGETYQFYLCQGVLFGIGNALIFTPALAIAGHWFKRKRAYVIGIIASGSALGGIVYPILLQRLISSLGFGWAVRVAAFVTMACLCISSLTIRTNLPLKKEFSLAGAVDFSGFLDVKYTLSAIGAFLGFYALFIPFFYIESYGLFQDVDPTLAKYLLVIMNGLGIPARILPGLLADKAGSLNVLIPTMFLSGVWCFAIWLPSRGAASVTAFAALYGLFSGGFVSLLPSYIASITPVEKFGARLGSIYFVIAIANLVGTPTAGAFLKEIDQKHFEWLIIFTGTLILAGAATFTAARFVHARSVFARV